MITEELVIRLYQQGIITSAQGTRMLGTDRLRFERFLAENEIPIHSEPDEPDTDIKNLKERNNGTINAQPARQPC